MKWLFVLFIGLIGQSKLVLSQENGDTKVDSMLTILDGNTHDTVKIQTLFKLAETIYLSNPDSALYFCHKAQKKANEIDYYDGILSSYTWIGYIHWQKSELKEALETFQQAIDHLKPEDKQSRGVLSNNLGYMYKDLGDFEKALYYLQEGLKYRRLDNDTSGISNSLNNIGLIHKDIGDYDKALEYLEESLKLRLHTESASNVLNNIATIWGEQGNNQKAIEYLYRSLSLASKKDDYGAMAMIMDNLGFNYQDLNYPDSALYYFNKSIETSRLVGNKYWESSALSHLGRFYMKNDQPSLASTYLQQAYDLAKATGYPARIRDISELLFKLNEKTNNWEQAFFYHQVFTKVRDSLVNVANLKQVYKYELSYEYERKMFADSIVNEETKELIQSELNMQKQLAQKEKDEKERNLIWAIGAGLLMISVVVSLIRTNSVRKKANRVLSTKNDEITKTSQELEEALGERDLLLKEIHHRVKNNLQTVSSLMSLQSRYLREPAAIEALEESQNRLLSISLLHQKLYQNEKVPLVVFKTYLSELSEQIMETCSTDETEVEQELVCDELICNIELAMPLGLIVNELMTNAYKYAFPGRPTGKIKIRFSVENDNCILELSDNGVGFPEGFSLEESQSMGHNLVKLLVKQIQGEMKVEQEAGLKFVLSFKRPKNKVS